MIYVAIIREWEDQFVGDIKVIFITSRDIKFSGYIMIRNCLSYMALCNLYIYFLSIGRGGWGTIMAPIKE